jgi:putative cell wall-binding protein
LAFSDNPLESVVMQGPVPTTMGSRPFGVAGATKPLVTFYSIFASSGYTTPTWTAGGQAYASQALAAPLPVVSGVSPSSGSTSGGTSVTVTGSSFTGATSVTFGGVAGTNLTVINDSTLTVTAPAHAAGTVDATVTTPSGSSLARAYRYGTAPHAFADGVTRLFGESRYDTAIGVSQQYAPGVPAVFVATGTNFPDALSAAAAAAFLGGPLLLTTPTELPAAVKAEIQRLAPAKIFVIGGTGAVSESVASELATIAPVTRYGGADRYDTGLQIVDGTFTSSRTAILATGRSFPDALAATGVAGSLNAPVILIDGVQSSVTAETLSALSGLGVTNVIIAGGTSVISTGIEAQLTSAGYSVTRYGGADRYSTAALMNTNFFPHGSTDTMFLATGTNFPDALAGAALAGRLGAPLYITTPGCAPTAIHDSVAALNPSKTAVLGGPTVVSDNAAHNQVCT